jgi:predicted esterase
MLKPLSLLLIGTTSVLFPLASQGMGFGELRGSALLNRPLSFAARVHLEPDEVLEAGCVQAEVLAGDERLGPEIKSRPPVLLLHGDRDEMLPHHLTERATEVLRQHGVKTTMHIAEGVGHGIDQGGLSEAARFLLEAFRLPLPQGSTGP